MKFKILILALFASFNLSIAQSTLNEGFIQFEITDIKSDDPQTAGMLESMKGGTVDVYFKDKKQRVDIDMMGGMIKMTTLISDVGDKPNTMYMDMMGQKLMIPMDNEEFSKYQNKGDENQIKPTVTRVAGETKTIMGYTCEKVIITYDGDESMKDMKLTAYVTDKIAAPHNVIQNGPADLDLGGFPLAYSLVHPQMTMSYEVTKLEKSVENSRFTQPEGYREMDFKQFMDTMGAMGGLGQ